MAPNIAAVGAEPIPFEGAEGFCRSMISMTAPALELGQIDMGGVREVDIFRLPRVDKPGNLQSLGDIGTRQLDFIFRLTDGRFMAAHTVFDSGNPREAAIIAEGMAFLTGEANIFARVQSMIE